MMQKKEIFMVRMQTFLMIFFVFWVAETLGSEEYDFSLYGQILESHVKPGREVAGIMVNAIDYQGVKSDDDFSLLLDELENYSTDELFSVDGKRAFWVNVYNIGSMKMIVDHYPVNSIRSPKIHLFGNPWDIKIITVGGKKYSLKQIEYAILFDELDYREAHFLINCASASCPPLQLKPITKENLDEVMRDAAAEFLRNPLIGLKEEADKKRIIVSRIFKFDPWFRNKDNLAQFLAFRYGDNYILDKEIKVHYLNYDWTLIDVH